MPSIKINTYKNGAEQPDVTITIPTHVFKIAKKLIPKKAYAALEEQGIDLNGIDELIRSEATTGIILEVEDHRKQEKTVISIDPA